ncbi:MAG: aspartate aminotransferase family protein [Dehalococcoidia bacterium]|nr:aspartate aminotransferase family protein [Dehalococcoidia bacterium]|tara:strand:+ start:1077 stop:2270 length:1194 start_codon:yes stop_codon:yes gene_type:complete
MTTTDWKKLESTYYMQVVNRLPLVLVKGQGTIVWDESGKKYLDFTSGWAVMNLGHTHPAVSNAIKYQVDNIMQMTNLFYTIPQLKLAKLLIDNSCFDRVFFSNSGAEANEGACKLARKWGKHKLDGAYEIITMENSFHGRTLAMMAATGQKEYQEKWQPLPEGFVNVEYNNIEAIKKATKKNTCAVLLEVVQGEGGVNIPDHSYLLEVQEWCHQNNILFMVDEVQTGMGRLGTLFGYQKFGLDPDVMVLGKALGAGTPLGAFLCKERFSVLEAGDHGSTFGGNALTTAAGWSALKYIIDNDIASDCSDAGKYLKSMLDGLATRHPNIVDIRGYGLLIGVEISKNKAPDVMKLCLEKGLLVNAVRPNTLRLFPPLNVTEGDINKAIEILEEAFVELKI